MQRLKVCQIIPTLVRGGAEKQMSLLARNLAPDRFESHVVVLTHSGPVEQELRDAGVQVHVIGKRGKFDPFAYRRLTAKLRELQPSIVHTWIFAANSYGRAAAKHVGVPVIVAGERCVDPWKQWWHHAIDRHQAKTTDAIVTNSSGVRDFYAAHGVPSSKFQLIPNAVTPPSTPAIDRAELLRRLDIPERGRVVGAVGRLWKQKGYEDLVWAGELLRVAYEDVWLVIVGDGPERERLLKFRDQARAHPAVRFVGHRDDAAELIGGFDLLWNGSHYEGQSNTILEAMARGVPVIASDIAGNRDLVIPNETGFLFKIGDVDRLTRESLVLLQNDELRDRMGAAAKQRVESDFSLAKMVAAHEELYLRLWRVHR